MEITNYYTCMDLNGTTPLCEVPTWNSLYFITSKNHLSQAISVVKEWFHCAGIKLGYNREKYQFEVLSYESSPLDSEITIYNKKGNDNEQVFATIARAGWFTNDHCTQSMIIFNKIPSINSIEIHLINIMDVPIGFINNDRVAYGRILGQGFYPVLCKIDSDKINDLIGNIQSLPDIND